MRLKKYITMCMLFRKTTKKYVNFAHFSSYELEFTVWKHVENFHLFFKVYNNNDISTECFKNDRYI